VTRQEQNEIIIRHIDAELRDKPDVQQKIGSLFAKWFQQLVSMAQQPVEGQEGPPMEGEPA